MCVPGAVEGQKEKDMHPLELELQAFVRLVGAGNGTWVLPQEQSVLLTSQPSLYPLYMDDFCICVSLCPFLLEERKRGRGVEEKRRDEDRKRTEGGVTAVVGGPQEVWQARPL